MTERPRASLLDYAPGGTLRVALNHGNRVLVDRDAAGRAEGISVALARALAARLRTTPRFVDYARAGDVADAATQDAWDVCFLAVDPARAGVIDFTQPYIRIEGAYLLRSAALAASPAEVVAQGLRIGSVRGSAYSLHLSRQPGAAALTLFASMEAAVAALDAGAVDGLAGIRKAMDEIAAPRPAARVLAPPFMQIRQAMGLPRGRPRAHAHLCALLHGLARDGTTRAILERFGIDGGAAILPEP